MSATTELERLPNDLPGWKITADGHWLVARRQEPLTDYQREYGAQDELAARSEAELRVLCAAHDQLAAALTNAEQIAGLAS